MRELGVNEVREPVSAKETAIAKSMRALPIELTMKYLKIALKSLFSVIKK